MSTNRIDRNAATPERIRRNFQRLAKALDGHAPGTVTSVSLVLPASLFTVTGSPVTSSGTLTGTFTNQSANTVFAGPASGAATTPSFRAIVVADLPTVDIAHGGTGQGTANAALNALLPSQASNAGKFLKTDGTNTSWATASGGGLTSPLTTKGDVWGFSTVDARIPVGSNGSVLTADSAQALGVKWATVSSFTSPLTTKGDIHVYSTVDDRMPIGADGTFLIADSTKTTGMRWDNIIGSHKGYILTSNGTSDLTIAAGNDGQVLTADAAQTGGLKWANPEAVSEENFRLPVGFGVTNSTLSVGTTTTVHATYLGKAFSGYTTAKVVFQITSATSISVTWAECAIAIGDFPTGTSAPVLTTVGFVSIATQVAAAGTYEVTITLSGVARGNGLWLVFGRTGGANNITVRGVTVVADATSLIRQFAPSTTTRPQSLSSTTMTLGTSGTQWTGLARFT